MLVKVAYAGKKEQYILDIELDKETTVEQAIVASGILSKCPEINLKECSVGIFSSKISLDDLVFDGQRVEIYRDLTIDPKDARRIRAENKRKKYKIKAFGA